MNVSLTPQLEELVKRKVESGLYNSSSEVIREALRLLEERDRLQEIRLVELKQEIKKGLDQLDRGEGIDGKEVMAELRARAKARLQQNKG
jgi:antitoxin ParD1/3/4